MRKILCLSLLAVASSSRALVVDPFDIGLSAPISGSVGGQTYGPDFKNLTSPLQSTREIQISVAEGSSSTFGVRLTSENGVMMLEQEQGMRGTFFSTYYFSDSSGSALAPFDAVRIRFGSLPMAAVLSADSSSGYRLDQSVAAGSTYTDIKLIKSSEFGSPWRFLSVTVTPADFNAGVLTVDSIEAIQAVPEPTSVAALGLGAVAVLRRKRR